MSSGTPIRPKIMDEKLSKPFVLSVEATGLTITALAVLTIAAVVHLVLRLVSGGAFLPDIGLLSFGFVFYVFSLSLCFATQQRPGHAPFLLGQVGMHGGFLVLGWLLFRDRVPAAWLLSALALTGLTFGGRCVLAALRTRSVDALLAYRVAKPEAFVERVFFVRSWLYLAIPAGALLASAVGAVMGAPAEQFAYLCAAFALALTALRELWQLLLGARFLAGNFVAMHQRDEVAVSVSGISEKYRLHMRAPQPSSANGERSVEAAGIAAAIRGVQMMSQLERLLVIALCAILVRRLALAPLPLSWLALALGGLYVLMGPVAYWFGQRNMNARVLAPLSQELKKQASTQLSARASAFPPAAAWLALGVSILSALAAYACLA